MHVSSTRSSRRRRAPRAGASGRSNSPGSCPSSSCPRTNRARPRRRSGGPRAACVSARPSPSPGATWPAPTTPRSTPCSWPPSTRCCTAIPARTISSWARPPRAARAPGSREGWAISPTPCPCAPASRPTSPSPASSPRCAPRCSERSSIRTSPSPPSWSGCTPSATRGLAGRALEEPGEEAALGELRLESWPLPHRAAQFELSLALAETREGLSASMEYNTDLFEAGTIDRMLGHLRVLWEALAARPEQRVTQPALLTAEEFAQQAAWNDTATVYEGADTLHGLVEAQSARTPDAVAVRFEDETLTYRELELRANQLAHHLRGLGVGPEVRVGVCMERSLELVVGLLGVLKAGGAYVPLDPSYPRERLNHMLRDSAAPVLLTQERLPPPLPPRGGPPVLLGRG